MKTLTIIGGGPAALLLAARLNPARYRVTLCEQKKTAGRKFLVAGEGGLNLTYDEPLADLIGRYSPADFMAPFLRRFTNHDLRNWLAGQGVPTFTGSSRRVFPNEAFKPIEVLKRLLDAALHQGVTFRPGARWTGWGPAGELLFADGSQITSDLTVFALGGASWKVTGSDGAWALAFRERGLRVTPFRSANCAFGVAWDPVFLAAHEGKPLKNIAALHQDRRQTGELTITNFGLEGNAIYPLSESIQDELAKRGSALIHLDLKPTLSARTIRAKYQKSGTTKATDFLRRTLRLDRTALALLKHATDRSTFLDTDRLLATIKRVPIILTAAGPLDEAISSLGGLALEEVDATLQLRQLPATYAIGEMLDWYAPTGGYLLQGCLSMGYGLADHLNRL